MKIEVLLDKLPGPARRAIEGLGLKKVEELARFPEADIAMLHGIGPKALHLMTEELAAIRRSFAPATGRTGVPEGPAAVDAYIAAFPAATRGRREAMRRTIRSVAPEATEKIDYGMPTFVLNGNLVHFAGYARHIGFYPGAAGIATFEGELARYQHAKGSVQFPLDEPVPHSLVKRIGRFRVEQNLKRKRPRRPERGSHR